MNLQVNQFYHKRKGRKPAESLFETPMKSEHPKVTVIVPVYKVDRFLVPCLDSIVNQTLQDIEIIIVDEGDLDRCREIIDYYEKNDTRIVAPHQHNGGYGASCNLGIEMAKGKYISIVESDDIILPEMLEEMYAYAEKLDADVLKTPFCFWDGRDNFVDCEYRSMAAQQSPKGKLFSMKEYNYLLSVHASLWSGLYKTSYMREKNIRFVEAKGGAYVDVGFRIDTLINTDKVAWMDKPYYMYRTNNDESTTNNFNMTAMLHRWNEAHKKFADCQTDYDVYYGPALIIDEYLNTLSRANASLTEKQRELLIENFRYVNEKTILRSHVLNTKQKKEILAFKKNPHITLLRKTMRVAGGKLYSYLANINNMVSFDRYIVNVGIVSIISFLFSILLLLNNNRNIYVEYFAEIFVSITVLLMTLKYGMGLVRRFLEFAKREKKDNK